MNSDILAGPILRRTTPNRICVWIATSKPMGLTLTIMDEAESVLGSGCMELRHSQGIKLGEQLYVHLLQARAGTIGSFPKDKMLFYRVDYSEEGIQRPFMDDTEWLDLAYGSYSYPSFFIPSELKRLLHGSCRKPHGQSSGQDALISAHRLIKSNPENLDERPALLLMNGDQIYADDVAVSLAATLRTKAHELVGHPEALPLIGNPDNIPLHDRKDILDHFDSGFTSQESYNHLFSFGEYAAMYLYSLGNYQQWEPVWDWDRLKDAGIKQEEQELCEEAYAEQKEFLSRFHNALPMIRKSLANIPTYMLFDDHDVTDDWNITHCWYDNVRDSDLGRRIVSNALAACWAFQSWGNDPDNFDKDTIWSIEQYLRDETNDPAIGERFDLYMWKHRGWGFSIPTTPPVIAVDSRTQRQYDVYNMPARLMDRYGIDWLRVEWSKLVTDKNLAQDVWPIVITATPVLGFDPIEGLQNKSLRITKLILQAIFKRIPLVSNLLLAPLDRALINGLDIESWSANKKGYKALFDALQLHMNLPGCIFLSGDVHYAFTSKGSFECDGKVFPCVQLTSSAMHNMPSETNQKFLQKLSEIIPRGSLRVWLALGWRKRWSSHSQLIGSKENGQAIYGDGNIGLVVLSSGKPLYHQLLTGDGTRTYVIE
ncbi:hypothetical protein [Vibrio viridaestus]|uniref:Alkaline phosphatase family protein n=1 Tax=Vibrio viridaestus TaxID=2487322 RepID=A0A3N9U921_9VIBR|nr:hypothetical protein [Vibrio viridaestus]RQW64716.1 hypothetical protein EES38_01320 [Vibrio viridaestus]